VEPEGARAVKLRMGEQEVPYAEIRGASLCRGFTPGYAFRLSNHFDRQMNGRYVITAVQHTATQSPWYVAEEAIALGEPYRNTFTCIPEDLPYQPLRETPRPVVQGPQTAIVVGPPGEEIHTDEFGRVKVQFHWDREGQHNEKSSCWVRVSQPWAGQSWGGVSIPRIGQEVVVDFLEGDPDQPLITGRLYNAESMPPYGLPASAVVSGMKTNSTPGGGGYNEMSMNDTKGKEMITVHAQYDMSTTILHDETISVKNNRTEDVLDGNETITVHTGKRTVSINTGDEELNVLTGKRTVNVNTGDDTHNVLTGKRTVNVSTGTDTLNVITADQMVNVSAGSAKLTVAAANREVLVPAGTYSVAAKIVEISGTQEILLAVGNNSIKIDMSGITLFGTLIKIN
jgi:type VI secretion system secreted protein VgrG